MAVAAIDRLPEENILRYRHDLSKLVEALRQEGITPILVTHVDAFGETLSDSDRALLTSWRKFYPLLKEEGFLDRERRANEAVRSLGSEAGVPVIDFERGVPTTPESFTDFAHFSEAGAGSVAAALADGLLPDLNRQLSSPACATSAGLPREHPRWEQLRELRPQRITSDAAILVPGHGDHEADLLRRLNRREPAGHSGLEVVFEVIRGEAGRFQHDERRDLFQEHGVRHADNSTLGNLRAFAQRRLDLSRAYQVAGGVDDVVVPASEPEVALTRSRRAASPVQ